MRFCRQLLVFCCNNVAVPCNPSPLPPSWAEQGVSSTAPDPPRSGPPVADSFCLCFCAGRRARVVPWGLCRPPELHLIHRIARKAKFDAEKAERHGAAPAVPAHLQGTAGTAGTAAAAAVSASSPAAKEKKVYTSCKIRLQLKPPLSNQFDASATVDAIFEWARTAAPDCAARPFNLVMNRPRKVFSAGDATTIADSGLMPSAALQIAFL